MSCGARGFTEGARASESAGCQSGAGWWPALSLSSPGTAGFLGLLALFPSCGLYCYFSSDSPVAGAGVLKIAGYQVFLLKAQTRVRLPDLNLGLSFTSWMALAS